MSLFEMLWWYLGNIGEYCIQMTPCMIMGIAAFLLLYPFRRKRLQAKKLVSNLRHEVLLIAFIMFCSGLAALTLFPADFWSYITTWLFQHDLWVTTMSHQSLGDFYPAWDQTMAEVRYLPEMLEPLQEIRRAFVTRNPWLIFMLVANIGMFLPIGAIPGLLWRGWIWWKAILIGGLSSCSIEFIQFFIGRSTDIDDVLLNTSGAFIGFVLYRILRAVCPQWTTKFICKPEEMNPYGLFK